jgi:hypothetical protein
MVNGTDLPDATEIRQLKTAVHPPNTMETSELLVELGQLAAVGLLGGPSCSFAGCQSLPESITNEM